VLKRLQSRRCAASGKRLWKTAEVDHRMPLFRVWGEQRETPWPVLLGFWGFPNLQIINREVHAAKCAAEAKYRGERRSGVDNDKLGKQKSSFESVLHVVPAKAGRLHKCGVV
jgi:hypothetical protein